MSTLTLNDLKQPRSLITLAIFLIVVIGIGSLIGTQNVPGAWYDALTKPPFNPPNWVFGMAMGVWVLQMVLNWVWSPAFFGAENLWLAFAIIIPMLASILAFIALSWKRDRVSAWLFIPYACWVSFASLLNFSLILLN